jgi:hypothetical protein
MTWFRSIVASEAPQWHVATLEEGEPVPPNGAYLNIHLRSLRVLNVRKGLKRFAAAVHSFVEFEHISTGRAAIHTFTVPQGLQALDPDHLDRVVQSSQRLLGPVPYRGGDVSIDIALFSIETGGVLDDFVAVIGDLASAAGVEYVNAALPFVKPIENAVQRMVGQSGPNVLEIGLSKDLEAPRTGLFLVMRAPAEAMQGVELVRDEEYRVSRKDGLPLDYPYLTFEIATTEHRKAYFAIPELRATHDDLSRITKIGNVPAARDQFAVFRSAVLNSPDLLLGDAQRIVEEAELDLTIKLGASATSAGRGQALTPLEKLRPFG